METLHIKQMQKVEELLMEKLNLEYQIDRYQESMQNLWFNDQALKPLLQSSRECRLRIEEINKELLKWK
jgi:hypothetical protein